MLSLLPVRGMAFRTIFNMKATDIGDPWPPGIEVPLDKDNTLLKWTSVGYII